MPHLSEEQWRLVLELSEAVSELPAGERLAYLERLEVSPDTVEEVLTVVQGFHVPTNDASRVGTRIDRFLITEHLGRGGVGEVYAATDEELGRTVALKFLTEAAGEQAGASERFIREARTASALNHPNIVTIHEFIHSGTTVAIVMEYVDGQALRQMCGSQLPLSQVIQIGRQAALALAAAHGIGIVHRDIKPENMITRGDGVVKVLDFGLATWMEGQAQAIGVSSSHLFAGTWRYMSPEQNRGDAVTSATDIFSLGLVLCELLSGRRPDTSWAPSHSSSTAVGAVTRDSAQPIPKVPKVLIPLITSMLAHAASDRPAAVEVAEQLRSLEGQLAPEHKRKTLIVSITLILVLTVIGIYLLLQARVMPPLFASAISVEPGYKWSLTFSPDGNHLAYAWDRDQTRQIYLQSIDPQSGGASDPYRLTAYIGYEDLPAWSPDGKTLAFTRTTEGGTRIILHDMQGGKERILTRFEGRSLAWTTDGNWLLTARGADFNHVITLISPRTGELHALTASKGEINDSNPVSTADASSVLFVRFFSDSLSRLARLPLNTNGRTAVAPSYLSWPDFRARKIQDPAYTGDGRDLFFIAQTDSISRIWRSHAGRTPVVMSTLGENIDGLAVPLRRNRLAYLKNLDDTNIWRVSLKATPSTPAGSTSKVITSLRSDQRPAVSPNGSQVAFESDRSGFLEVWVTRLADGKTRRLTNLNGLSGSPRWSPDGRWIVFDSRVNGSPSIFKIAAAGGGQPRQLTDNRSGANVLPIFSPDGRWIYFTSHRSGYYQIWRVPANGGIATVVTTDKATAPEMSPDGRYLFYLEKFWATSRLWRKDLETGQVLPIADAVFFRGFAVGKNIIYALQTQGRQIYIYALSLNGTAPRIVSRIPGGVVAGMTLDPEENYLYYSQLDDSGDEVMLVNDFQ